MGHMDRRPSDVIADTLRARICLHATNDVMILHEGKIAEEFGVSRTPVRQVLQTLAYEHLVETKAGIGTIATPLDAGMFERDLKTAQSMLAACAATALHPIPRDTRFALTALLAMAKDMSGGQETRAVFFDVAQRLLATLLPTITDPLVASAYTASYLRIVRWRLRMFDRNPGITWERMLKLIEAGAGASTSQESGAIFLAMCAQAKSSQYAPWDAGASVEAPVLSNVQNIR